MVWVGKEESRVRQHAAAESPVLVETNRIQDSMVFSEESLSTVRHRTLPLAVNTDCSSSLRDLSDNAQRHKIDS
jgi:hypothetical protein